MGIFNKLTQSLFAGGESQPSSEKRLLPESVPALGAEYYEIDLIVGATLEAMNQLPKTHPYLVAQMNREKIAQQALAQAMAPPNVKKSYSNIAIVQETQPLVTAEVPQQAAEIDTNIGFQVPNDLSGEDILTAEIAAARAGVAAIYTANSEVPQSTPEIAAALQDVVVSHQINPEVPTLTIPTDRVDATSPKVGE